MVLLVRYQNRVAGVGWLSANATESLSPFGERVFASFCDNNLVFLRLRKNGQFLDVIMVVLLKNFKFTISIVNHFHRKLQQSLYESRLTLVESSPKAS